MFVLSRQRLNVVLLIRRLKPMQSAFLLFATRLRSLIKQQFGQDLVEYALVIALIALGATVGMKQLAGGINKAFNSVSDALSTDI
jgi:pilus assembly protein Flp/PilA